ncbi:response regulator [Oricola sp.]|uniref:response regulator n=1 Tax=Oricola sp. TaxID=1979950 RepID=UPI0025E8F9CC|nr:response regulator [Oricola sp.]MCI5075891.1 response regulator [Oricola sp.]
MSDTAQHILVCDDEADIRDMLAEYLTRRGFRVSPAGNATELRGLVEADAPDLIVLDINMPGEDGLSVLKSLRGGEDLPVVMLTAASDVIDRVIGLELGADDYLGKPVDLRELEARIKAVLRRKSAAPKEGGAKAGDEPKRFRFGKTWLDLEAAKLSDENGEEIPLTSMEFNLLKLFARNRGRVLNRDQILEGAHDRSWDPFDRSIDIRISRIRRKIELNPQKPTVIRTVRGIGYIYDET